MNFKKAILKAQPVSDNLPIYLSNANWAQRRLAEWYLPLCIARVPPERHFMTVASGDLLIPRDYYIEETRIEAVGGLSSFHYDSKDAISGYPINEYDFVIVRNIYRPDIESHFLSFGPFKPIVGHWQESIPKELFDIPLLEVTRI